MTATDAMLVDGAQAETAVVAASAQHHVHEDGSHAEEYRPMIRVLPFHFTKVVHLVRHGQGFHNVAGHINHDNYLSWDYEDSHLTELGWSQAAALKRHIASMPADVRPEVVVVAPLTRALETAVGAFGGGRWEQGGAAPLMVELSAEPGKRTAHAAVSADGVPPFVAWEGCREHFGRHPCDRRRPIRELAVTFPSVDFSLVVADEDPHWRADHRESKEEICARGRAFFAWLARRPERRIAVVSHSSFLHFALSCYAGGASTAVQGALHRWYENCEMRTVVLADEGALAAQPACDWAGGHAL